jgi:signal transduction histidine kinase
MSRELLMSPTAPDAALALDVTPAELARLRVQVEASALPARPCLMATLAWHLRQRDTAQALALADQAAAELPVTALAWQARLLLVRAEARWLAADLPQAFTLASQALAGMADSAGHCGPADAHALLGQIALDQAQPTLARSHFESALARAQAAGDVHRAAAAQGQLATRSALGDIDSAEQQWGVLMRGLRQSDCGTVAMWAHDYVALVSSRLGDYALALAAFQQLHERAMEVGQKRRAILALLNISTTFLNLNDFPTSLAWVERGVEAAKTTGWPASHGSCLMLLGRVLGRMGLSEPAATALEQAQAVVQPLAGSRTELMARFYATELAQELGRYTESVEGYAAIVAAAQGSTAGAADLAQYAHCGLAMALLGLSRHGDALAAGQAALADAVRVGSVGGEVTALRGLGKIHAALADLGPVGGTTVAAHSQAALDCLRRAAERAASLSGYTEMPASWDGMARELARMGDPAQAYAMACAASRARAALLREQADQRAIAMSARMEVERTRAESERLQALAARAGERAALLQSTHGALEQLSRIGLEIVAQLDVDQVFSKIYGHLQTEVDAPHLSIWLLDEAAQVLHLRFGMEDGQAMLPTQVLMHSGFSNVARCHREQRELLHDSDPDGLDAGHIPGTLRTLTALFGPLRVRERAIGVMSMQSLKLHAYGERDRLIFRSLCAYGAIALNNAAVVQELEAARRELQQSGAGERLAREAAQRDMQQRSRFLISVSHSLRPPLAELHERLAAAVAAPDAVAFGDGSRLLARAFAQSHSVAGLARELLELARLESTAVEPVLEAFSMAELAHDLLQKFSPLVQQKQQSVVTAFEPGTQEVLADISMIERVMTILLEHALGRSAQYGAIVLRMQAVGGKLEVTWVDDGAPLDEQATLDLFQRPRAGDGSLALVLCRQLLLLHGSEPVLQHTPTGGTAVAFQLQRAPGP